MLVPITFIEIIDRLAYYANARQPFHCLARHKSMHRREHRHVICPLYVAASSLVPFARSIWIDRCDVNLSKSDFFFIPFDFIFFFFPPLFFIVWGYESQNLGAYYVSSNCVIKRIIFNGNFFRYFFFFDNSTIEISLIFCGNNNI